MTAGKTGSERITRARSHLLLDQPWFGAISLRLKVIEDAGATQTMSTDGSRLVFDPAWVAERTDAELMAVIAHEVLHCALLHPYRVGQRDLKRWNLACDYAINPLLVQQGFRLPEGTANDPQYAGLSAETIYARLDRDGHQPPSDGDPGGLQPQPDFTRAPQPETKATRPEQAHMQQPVPERMSAVDWQIAAEQATAVARKAAKIHGDTERAIKQARRFATDWRAILRQFVEQTTPTDYSWASPNRRHIANGLYLPGVVRENMPRLAVAIDTSSSIGQDLLDLFAAELTAILHEARPEALDVVYCDTRIQAVETFGADDPIVELHPRGGGGTRFQPVFDHFADNPPAGLIYFTDLEGPAPQEPDYPVLWATTETSTRPAPFGEAVRVTPWED
ncbi:MAG: vWA domain-containing protein [Dehalococcoidia bacterium]